MLRDEFTPPPKVDSMVIVLESKRPEVGEEAFKVIRAGFVAPRKKVISNLGVFKSREELAKIFEGLKIDLNARPADLKLEDWQKLSEALLG